MGNISTPKIRFPDFKGEWINNSLGEIAKFSKGKGISKEDISETGETECIRYGELYTTYNETIDTVFSKTNIDTSHLVLSEANDVIIPASGETEVDIAKASCILKSGIALGGDLNIIKTLNNGVFLSYYLNSKKKIDIAKLAQGISVVHLYAGQLSKLQLKIPSLFEQQKIASFFTAIDQKISQLKRKKTLLEQYKKGVMQKIFSQEIRFKDDNGQEFPKWEKRKLGDVGKTYNGLTGKTKDDFGQGKPYIQYKQIFDDTRIDISRFDFVRIRDGEKQCRVRYGDVFFTTSSETPDEVGTSSVLLDEVSEVYLNSFCFGYRSSRDVLIPQFSRYLFRNELLRKEINKLAQGSTRYNISKNELMKTVIELPTIQEQTKIANFLSAIDEKINNTRKQIEKAEVWKKGLMQQMFV